MLVIRVVSSCTLIKGNLCCLISVDIVVSNDWLKSLNSGRLIISHTIQFIMLGRRYVDAYAIIYAIIDW